MKDFVVEIDGFMVVEVSGIFVSAFVLDVDTDDVTRVVIFSVGNLKSASSEISFSIESFGASEVSSPFG